MSSGEDLNQRFFEATGISISLPTVYRELRKMGFKTVPIPRKKRPKPEAPIEKVKVRKHRCKQRRPVPGPGREQAYPSDLTDAEWEILEPLIPVAKPGGRPEEWPKREIVNAILYVLRSGCPWRMLPHDFPPYTTVYDYFRAWRDQGLWERINTALSKHLRVMTGRNADPSAAIVDSQSAKTTEKGGPVGTTVVNEYLAGSVTLSSTRRGC
jgi:transposase